MDLLPNDIMINIINLLDLKSFLNINNINKYFKELLINHKKTLWLNTIPKICLNNRWTLMHAVKDNEIDYFKWILKSGIKYDVNISLYASKLNRVNFLNYIHIILKNKYDKRIKDIAIRDNNIDVINWCINLNH